MKGRAGRAGGSGERTPGSGRSAVGRAAVLVAAAALVPLLAPASSAAQGQEGGPELQTHRFHGLELRAPAPMESPERLQRVLQKRIAEVPALAEAQMSLWNGGNRAVSVVHFGVAEGGDYSLDRGLRGSLNRTTRRLGGTPESGPDAYSIRSTSVSGHPARTGSKRIQRPNGTVQLRTLVTKAGRDVWVVSVFGVDGETTQSIADAVFESLSVGG